MKVPPKKELERFFLTDIYVGDGRMRQLNDGTVTTLADSIGRLGLRAPIAVRMVDVMDMPGEGEVHNVPVLVAGRHRLEACRRLGFDMIDCHVIRDETEARLWEIAENLHRSELTVQERADHIAEWVRLTEDRLSDKLSENARIGRPGVAAAASRELGINEREVQRAVKISGITGEAKEAARGAGLTDNQSALLEVAKAPAEQQVAKVEELRMRRDAGQASNRVSVPRDPVKAAEALCKAFSVDELAMLIAVLMKSRQSDAA